VTRVTPFVPSDYVEAHAALWTGGADFVDREAVARHYAASPAFSARLDGVLLASAGIDIHWAGLGTAWAIITPAGCQHYLRVHRAVLAGLRQIIADRGLRRVQAHVQADNFRARRWVEALGFAEEATLPAYGPSGESFVLAALIPKEAA
jgi:hypothetical protein